MPWIHLAHRTHCSLTRESGATARPQSLPCRTSTFRLLQDSWYCRCWRGCLRGRCCSICFESCSCRGFSAAPCGDVAMQKPAVIAAGACVALEVVAILYAGSCGSCATWRTRSSDSKSCRSCGSCLRKRCAARFPHLAPRHLQLTGLRHDHKFAVVRAQSCDQLPLSILQDFHVAAHCRTILLAWRSSYEVGETFSTEDTSSRSASSRSCRRRSRSATWILLLHQRLCSQCSGSS